jgi:hypothetical protein
MLDKLLFEHLVYPFFNCLFASFWKIVDFLVNHIRGIWFEWDAMIPCSTGGEPFRFLLRENFCMLAVFWGDRGVHFLFFCLLEGFCHFLGDGGFSDFHGHSPDFIGFIDMFLGDCSCSFKFCLWSQEFSFFLVNVWIEGF